MAAAAALTEAIARLDGRYGARTVATATSAEDRSRQRRFFTGTMFDRASGGLAAGRSLALIGEGGCGKVTLAMRAVAGAQRDGGMALWVDAARSFDPLAAHRLGVELRRLVVVRARGAGDVLFAASAALRSVGFRIVVVDLGPSFARTCGVDALAPLLPQARGSTSALVIVSDEPPLRLSLPTYRLDRSPLREAV